MKARLSIIAFVLASAVGVPTLAVASDAPSPPAEQSAQQQSAQPGTDAWISMHVKEQLTNAKEIPAKAISVATINGVVMLAGIVDTPDQVQKSIAIAKATQGVRSVDSTALNSRH